MHIDNVKKLKRKLEDRHLKDKEQLKVIFSEKEKIIVEAPAGYGKTKTMISRIAYLIASESVRYPKKILALTFSVNAAYKIKKDVAEELPDILSGIDKTKISIDERLYISNYHGFARHVLKLYGYLIHENLRKIDELQIIDDNYRENLVKLELLDSEIELILDFNEAIKTKNKEYLNKNWDCYIKILKEKIVEYKLITYNAILAFILELFRREKEIVNFYKRYFSAIIVDEFQDTNLLSYKLLRFLIGENTKVMLMGDPLQRIYGFIGAIDNLMTEVRELYKMEKEVLLNNYRFKDNNDMLMLHYNIRKNAENLLNPEIEENAKVPFVIKENQYDEAQIVCEKVDYLCKESNDKNVAILVKQRGKNVDVIIDCLEKNNIDFFYALFKDDDVDYIEFHDICLDKLAEFKEELKNKFSKKNLEDYYNEVENCINKNKTNDSLLILLELFLDKIINEYALFTIDEKINFMIDTFQNKALKQHLDSVEKRVIISTIHGAKGLEWDYVFIVDMEQFVFPNYNMCWKCNDYNNKSNEIINGKCTFIFNEDLKEKFLDELSVFYVGVTRAKKRVYCSASRTRLNKNMNVKDTFISCLLSLRGIEPEINYRW